MWFFYRQRSSAGRVRHGIDKCGKYGVSGSIVFGNPVTKISYKLYYVNVIPTVVKSAAFVK